MEKVGLLIVCNFVCIAKVFFLLHPFLLTLYCLCSAELVQKEGIHYNDLVEKYVPSDHVNSASPNNSSPEEGNGSLICV